MPLFKSAIAPQEADALRKAFPTSGVVEYSPNTPLFSEGLPADFVFFVLSGLIKLTHINPGGEEFIFGMRSTGSMIGAAAVVLDEPQPCGAITHTSCRLLRISAAQIRNGVEGELAFPKCLHEYLAREVIHHLVNFVEAVSRPAQYRLVKFLYDVAFGDGSFRLTAKQVVKIPFKQSEIAGLLAVSPEHVCRLLRHLEQKGMVLRKSRSLFVDEPEKLLSFLAPSALP